MLGEPQPSFVHSLTLTQGVAGTAEEMVCPGGELAFVTQMVKDSLQLKGQIHWYSSMLGKKASLKTLRRLLHDSKVTALRTTEFVQVSVFCLPVKTSETSVRPIQGHAWQEGQPEGHALPATQQPGPLK